ncbi:unnamed protein product [Ectocarpus sp. 12 AP-2014]
MHPLRPNPTIPQNTFSLFDVEYGVRSSEEVDQHYGFQMCIGLHSILNLRHQNNRADVTSRNDEVLLACTAWAMIWTSDPIPPAAFTKTPAPPVYPNLNKQKDNTS